MSARSRISAGLLLFRRGAARSGVSARPPGRAFFVKKDLGCWTIPKGEAAPDEDLLTRARIEFAEEVGFEPPADGYLPLGTIQQKGGKIVHAWAVRGDLPDPFLHRSNTFELEWPPRSGKLQEFPEVDRAEFFPGRDRPAKDQACAGGPAHPRADSARLKGVPGPRSHMHCARKHVLRARIDMKRRAFWVNRRAI